jgi:hypothetical protein
LFSWLFSDLQVLFEGLAELSDISLERLDLSNVALEHLEFTAFSEAFTHGGTDTLDGWFDGTCDGHNGFIVRVWGWDCGILCFRGGACGAVGCGAVGCGAVGCGAVGCGAVGCGGGCGGPIDHI